MSQISKQALLVDNNQSFPTNNAGEITPSDLRAFNVNMIDSNVNQTEYTTNSGSWNVSISNLNTFTASQQPSFNALNSFTASQLTINSGVNLFTQSATGRLNNLESTTSSLNAWSSSINQIIVNGASIGTSTRFFFNGFVSASIIPNVNGPIASITILADQTFTPSASFNAYTASSAASQSLYSASVATSITSLTNNFNAYTASTNAWTASTQTSINQLLNLSASLSGGYATQGELDYSSSILQANIDTKTNTSSFNAYTASTNTSISSLNTFSASQLLLNPTLATTGSNRFSGSQTITGSVYNSVFSASIVSTTASLDLSKHNMFTLTLPAATITNINIQNIAPGQTAMLRIRNAGTAATASFSSNVFQPNTAYYVPTSGSGSEDILTFSSFDSSKAYLVSVLNMTNN
jgi:hypothetical protein